MATFDSIESDDYAKADLLLRGHGQSWSDMDEILGDLDVALLQLELDAVLARRPARGKRVTIVSSPSRHLARAA